MRDDLKHVIRDGRHRFNHDDSDPPSKPRLIRGLNLSDWDSLLDRDWDTPGSTGRWGNRRPVINTLPIEGFLRSSIGRNWDTVYSELRTAFDPRHWTCVALRRDLHYLVELNPVMVNGVPCDPECHNGYYCPLRRQFYRDPTTGLLQYYREPKTKCKPAPVESLAWKPGYHFELQTFNDPAPVCKCTKFNHIVESTRYYYRGLQSTCAHGRTPTMRKLWMVIHTAQHSPDEIYSRERISRTHRTHSLYGIPRVSAPDEPQEYLITYYRDRPDKLTYTVSRHSANHKHLELIRAALKDSQSSL